ELQRLGLSAYAMASAPNVKTHPLDVPRIGYVHSWTRTQDEGWVRAALDTYGIPYTYFGDVKLRDGNLRQKYDVIIMPHIGGTVQSMVNGIPKTGATPLPYRKTAEFRSFGTPDSSSDIRGEITDLSSPIVYGYERDQIPVYFNQGPVMRVATGPGEFFGGFNRGPDVGQDVTPMATPMPLSPWHPDSEIDSGSPARGPGRMRGRAAPNASADTASQGPRVILRFPRRPADMLLSGTLKGGEALSDRAQVVDESVGKGHIVMFAIRPFWRWQTQGTYMLGFNTIMNWDHLDAGRAASSVPQVGRR